MFDNEKVLKAMMGGEAVYGDIFVEEKTYTHIHLESGRMEKLEKSTDKGIGLRVITPWKTYYGSTNRFDGEHIIEMAGELAKFSHGKPETVAAAGARVNAAYPFSIRVAPGDVSVEEKIAMVRHVESLVKKMEPRVRQVRVIYRDTCQKVEICTSEGKDLGDTRTQVVLSLLLVGEEGGEIQTAYEAVGGFYGYEFFTTEVVEDLAARTVKRLAGLLSAREAPMGTKTVVLSSEAGGTMIHEAVGHGLEADLAMEGLSCYKGMIGESIASPLISVVDDGTVPNLRGTYGFDDEGVTPERTILVDNGVLKNFLFDRFHALKYGMASTGNGRRESYRFKPIPRMSNTMILPGRDDPSQIISSVDDGVLVVKMGGGQVDTVRGDFVFEISEGYVIEKGHVGDMVKNATMMGNGLKVLREIDMVGSDIGYGIGTCGKDGQGVPVSDAQPTLRIPEIVVGGRATD
ncbi:TldD/PmbA family protein [Syntrophorhabdus aromaticivorans]|uniref:TldD/PmbA family protein n=1 Tax=Syntrophorhabdus aromaticivorans TaxID=328301 RepID=UPI0003F74DF6|nr:TldD/PmbA family protein [Syntrophorhabdus aromaticivorans]